MNENGWKKDHLNAACMFQTLFFFFLNKRERKTIWNHGGAIFQSLRKGLN